MPTQVFLNLTKEKQQKVLNAGIKEFSNVKFEDVSIKNIVEDAQIARGSFYAYFEDKDDFLNFILSSLKQKMLGVEDARYSKNNDIFENAKSVMLKKIESSNMFENNMPKTFELFNMLSSSELGREFLLKTLTNSKDKEILISELINGSKPSDLTFEDITLIVEVLVGISKTIFQKLMRKQITKDEAIVELNKKFDFVKYGVFKK
ncbi:MAG: TetR/AcrR family transcriptional regulator [Spirochaetales bacterium]